MGSTELFFRRCPSLREFSRRLLGHAEPEGRPAKLTQFCSTLRARRAGHGAMARARLATSLSPVDSPSDDTSSAEICLAKLSRRWPAGRKKHDFTLLYGGTDMLPKEKMKQVERKKMGEKVWNSFFFSFFIGRELRVHNCATGIFYIELSFFCYHWKGLFRAKLINLMYFFF